MTLHSSPEEPEALADLEAAQKGDLDALARLLEGVGGTVRGRIRGRVPDRWQALLTEDDVMQVSYLEAILRWDQFAGNSVRMLRHWLLSIAENNLRDALRELARVKRPDAYGRQNTVAQNHGSGSVALLELLGMTHTTPSQVVAREEIEALLQRALDQLPRDYARVIRCYDLEQKSALQTAEELGRSTGAMHMLRVRAHDRLRELLGSRTLFFSEGPSG